jgi:hypothetical protein
MSNSQVEAAWPATMNNLKILLFSGLAVLLYVCRGPALGIVVIGGVIAYEFIREGADVYKVPVAQAHELLKWEGLPDIFGEPKKFDVDSRDPRKIVWIVKDDGEEAIRLTALLSPVDAGSTKVRVEVSGPTSGAFGDVQRRLSEYRTIRHLYVIGMKERVAATLEGREFSFVTLIPAATVATLSRVVGLAASNVQKTFAMQDAARSDRERQNIERLRTPR